VCGGGRVLGGELGAVPRLERKRRRGSMSKKGKGVVAGVCARRLCHPARGGRRAVRLTSRWACGTCVRPLTPFAPLILSFVAYFLPPQKQQEQGAPVISFFSLFLHDDNFLTSARPHPWYQGAAEWAAAPKQARPPPGAAPPPARGQEQRRQQVVAVECARLPAPHAGPRSGPATSRAGG